MGREELTTGDAKEISRELEAQSDRGAAILAAAFIDVHLADVLMYVFRANLSKDDDKALFDDANGPLASFSSRIKMAHALGVIGDKTRADLNLIRKVRNEFAHKIKVRSFNEPPISDICRSLQLADISLFGGTPPTEPRARFIQAAILAIHFMSKEVVEGSPLGQRPTKCP